MLFVSIALLDAHTLPHTQAGRCPVQPQAATVSHRAALLTGRHHVPCLGVGIISEGGRVLIPNLKKKTFPDLLSRGHWFVGGFLRQLYIFMTSHATLPLCYNLSVFLHNMQGVSNLSFSTDFNQALNVLFFEPDLLERALTFIRQ